LSDGEVSVAILSLGCVTQDWRVPVGGQRIPVVLGYADPASYRNNPFYMGAIVGRVANRISGASFMLDGRRITLAANEGANQLHGGVGGLHTRNWEMDPDGDKAVRLSLVSEDGDQGFPGRVAFEVTISLCGDRLRYDMTASTDRPTPINLAQHNYYNLLGGGSVLDHRLQIVADRFTPVGEALIPTGATESLTGKPFDFRLGRRLEEADPGRMGLDMNFVLGTDSPAVRLAARNGLELTLATDQPCLQLFTAGPLRRQAQPLEGQVHDALGGVCLEPQGYPDAVNRPKFPPIVVTPDTPYRQVLDVTIAPAAQP
jgi:aldose 1-epimerase